jgi:hypothetical protein
MIPLTPTVFKALARVLGDGELVAGDPDTRLLHAVPGLAVTLTRMLAHDLKQVTLELAADNRQLSSWLREQGLPPGLAYVLLKRWVEEDEVFAHAYFATRASLLMEQDSTVSALTHTSGSLQERTTRLALEAGRIDPDKAEKMLPHGPAVNGPANVGGGLTIIDNRKQVVINSAEFQRRYLERMGMQRGITADLTDLV